METRSSDGGPHAAAEARRLTPEALYDEKIFDAKKLREPRWMRDGLHFSFLDHAPDSDVTVVWIYDVATGKREPVMDPGKLRLPSDPSPTKGPQKLDGEDEDDAEAKDGRGTLIISGYQWSPDESRLLFARPPRGHAAVPGDDRLYVFTLANGDMTRITRTEEPHRSPKWSPDGRYVGYVRGDDLYVVELASQKEIRLTDSAGPTLYNGRFGWLYEEELELVDGWAWSPDGSRIAYFQTDESQVPLVPIIDYDDLHCHPALQRYPKAGDPNPGVKIGVVDVPKGGGGNDPAAGNRAVPPTRWMDLGGLPDDLITQIQWTPAGNLLIHRMPRIQNLIDLLQADPATGQTVLLLSETDKAWMDARPPVIFVKATGEFLWYSDRDGNNHLYLYRHDGALIRQLTQGAWDVDQLCGIDPLHRMAYFTAARPDPTQRQVFSVLLDGGGDVVQISHEPGCHGPLLSPDGQRYLDMHSSRKQAPHVRLYEASGVHVAEVHANPMPGLADQTLGEWEFNTFKTSDGTTLYAALLKPADFDPKRQYPVVLYVYGGPGSQMAVDQYGNGGGLEQVLGQKGYLCAMVDGRGGSGRGRGFTKIVYQNLGHWEVNDQIEGARWLGNLPFVDRRRIGIWGWSYGGYVAALAITRAATVFKSAIAVAPVTHWSLYDTIYTERYMRRPSDNPRGYEASSPITYADGLKGSLMLVHGTSDDNVHFQHTARLAAQFQRLGKQFRTMFYPGKHHSMEGVSKHLYTVMTDFWTETL